MHGWCQKATAASEQKERGEADTGFHSMDNFFNLEKTLLSFAEGRGLMIVTEFCNSKSIVRIHDEYCQNSSNQCLENAAYIVSEFYRRRRLEDGEKGAVAVAAK